MSASTVPPTKFGDSERRLHATAANQTAAEEPLSKFASLLDRTSLVSTSTSLPTVAPLSEHVPGPATTSGEDIQPPNIVPLRSSNETHENPIETAAAHVGAALADDVRPSEPSRHSRGWKPKAFALASFVVIGALVALGSQDYVRGQAEIYGSMFLDAIAGLDDTPSPRGNVMPDERMALRTSEAPPAAAGPPLTMERPQSEHARVDSSEEQAVDASAPAAPGVSAPAPATNAPADVGPTQSGVGVSNVTPAATAVDTPLASVRAAAPVPIGSQGSEPMPVRTVSAPPDGTPTSSATGSTEASTAGNALRLSAKPPSQATNSGTAQASNSSFASREIPDGLSSTQVSTIPNVAAEMPRQPSKPAKRKKHEKSEKSANSPKLNAAEAAASSLPATSAEPPAAEQGATNPPQAAHPGRL
jgi:hypothetical protein